MEAICEQRKWESALVGELDVTAQIPHATLPLHTRAHAQPSHDVNALENSRPTITHSPEESKRTFFAPVLEV